MGGVRVSCRRCAWVAAALRCIHCCPAFFRRWADRVVGEVARGESVAQRDRLERLVARIAWILLVCVGVSLGGHRGGERWCLLTRLHAPSPMVVVLAPEDDDDLRDCMGRVFLIGCEAEYLPKLVGGGEEEDYCPRGGEDQGRDYGSSAPNLSLERYNRHAATPSANVDNGGETRAGSLVVHIRSGDIFKPDREGWHGMIWYGQVRFVVAKAPRTFSWRLREFFFPLTHLPV